MYNFTDEKIKILIDANEKMHICEDQSIEKNKNLIFIYCPPKVGSTSLVSSFRLFALNKYTVFHIHDESMLKVLCGVKNITINEIINYNKSLGKNVYVIDIYRSPVEQKISAFFEKIGSYHFNNTDENMNNYDINKLINRFNKLYPYLSRSDYYREVYNIPFPETFDFSKKYLCQDINGIKYIKLRLKDSAEWSQILNQILGIHITIVNDYETDKKIIKHIFKQFKENYRIPSNFIKLLEDNDGLKYYYSPQERAEYLSLWRYKQGQQIIPYSETEYSLYNEISRENQHISEIQRTHYIDVGCSCTGCSRKRNIIIYKLSKGEKVDDVIDHNKANNEYNNMILCRKKQRLITLVKKISAISSINNMNKKNNPKGILNGSFKQMK
jgi:hypothetical protein